MINVLLNYYNYIRHDVKDKTIRINFERFWLLYRPFLDKVEIIWTILTSLVPIYFFLTHKPFWLYFVAFILLDALGVFFNYVFFKWLPNLFPLDDSIEGQQKYCNQLLKSLKRNTQRIEKSLQFKKCNHCRYLYLEKQDENGINVYGHNSNCCESIKDYLYYIKRVRETLREENEKLETMLAELKKQEKKNQKQEDKEKYRTDVKEGQLQSYISVLSNLKDLNIKRVNTLIENISSLLDVLNTRPEVTKYVPETLYIYLNELSQILEKYSGFDNNLQKEYKPKIQSIVDELNRIISELSKKLLDIDLEDFDVSLDVLYRDLFPISRN